MTDWATISSLATAGGTLVLAMATFASVRTANRAAHATERSLMAGLRPVLVQSRIDDADQKVAFVDQHWLHIPGGHGVIDVTDEAIYLAIAVRNAGNGIAVLDGWSLRTQDRVPGEVHEDVRAFRRLTRDIYVAAGETGFWQGALRDPKDPQFIAARDRIAAGQDITVDLLYGDHEGGQRTVSRFTLLPTRQPDHDGWLASVSRHWNLDRPNPR